MGALPPDPDPEAGADPDPGAGVDPDPGAGVDPDPGAGVDPDPGAGVDPDPGAGVDPDPGAGVDPDPGAGVDPDPGAGVDPDPGAGVDPDPGAGADPEPMPTSNGGVTVSHLVTQVGSENPTTDLNGLSMNQLKAVNGVVYAQAQLAIDNLPLILPPSPAVVGIYARVDRTRGVFKAPANEGVASTIQPTIKLTNDIQDRLNVDTVAGKSINAIRSFTGKGTLIWGSRTLDGNSNEWRYVPVRRFFNMAEESIKKATERFVFEPNDANTWTKVRAMIENFLILQWRAGALAGAKPEQAFFVKVGLNETMTALDILEGRMIVEIGMAVVRPAEFIILKFSHKMQES
ncbi:MAG: hypothetical protein F6K16_30250 [Symploca sp. SIO2B6]|nr:hypothetical protein [Symploca sp. SIO2B6]